MEGVSRVVRILDEFRHWVLHAHAPASRGRRIYVSGVPPSFVDLIAKEDLKTREEQKEEARLSFVFGFHMFMFC